MAERSKTEDLERNILKVLMSNQLELRKHTRSINPKWFNNEIRSYIFNKILTHFEKDKSFFTEDLFKHSLQKEITDEKLQVAYEIEWNFINGRSPKESCEALIRAFKENERTENLNKVLEEVVNLSMAGKVDDALKHIKQKTINISCENEDEPVVSVTEYKDILNFMHDKRQYPEKYKGIHTGFKRFDLRVGGLFAAELTLIAAVTGVGKSTIMKQIGANIWMSGKNVLHVTNEENVRQVLLKYHSLITEIPYRNLKNPELMSIEEMNKYEKQMVDFSNNSSYGKLHIKEIPQFTDVTNIERTFIELEHKGERPDIIIIDYLDHMKPVQIAFNENDEQAKVAADAKGLSISCNVPVVAATQASTAAELKQDKGKKFGKFDIYGSKRKVHAANTLIFVIQEARDETQFKDNAGGTRELCDCDWLWEVDIAKNRDGPQFNFKCRQHVAIGKVEPIADEASKSEERKLLDTVSQETEKAQAKKKDIIEHKTVDKINVEVEHLMEPISSEELSMEDEAKKAADARIQRLRAQKLQRNAATVV